MERTRLRLNFMDSPAFANESSPAFSPMTHLALNLNDTNLSATPRRKLSLCSNDDTPTSFRYRNLLSDLSDVNMESPFSDRLLKNVIKFPASPAQATPTARGRPVPRRVIMSPLLAGAPSHVSNSTNSSSSNDKENRSASSPAPPMGPEEAVGAAPFLSPGKPGSPAAAASPARFLSPLRMRQPLEDHDPNSQDSGYGPVFADKDDKSGFRFMEPVGTAPRRQLIEQSPCKDMLTGSPHSRSSGYGSPKFFHSLSSGSTSGTESIDDGFVEFLDVEKSNEESQYPSGIGSLLSCPLKEQNASKKETSIPESRPRQFIRRSLSLNETSTRVSRITFGVPLLKDREETLTAVDNVRAFKRPDPPCENSSVIQCLKRPKINPMPKINEDNAKNGQTRVVSETVTTVRLQRSFSVSEATIKRALQRSSQDPDLIGDFSKPFILPLMQGRHQDLKTISSDTLANLIRGDYSDSVDSYTIIDCRYPYEYNGGHIKGAKNIYTQDQISKEFVEINKSKPVSTFKRNILIFHCEFSSERGPKLSRFLRNSDRVLNKEAYPALHYPEVYLLHGGYKEFFEQYKDLCEPCSYLPMLHPNHEADLRHFRAKTKSGDGKTRLALRSNSLKRLGL